MSDRMSVSEPKVQLWAEELVLGVQDIDDILRSRTEKRQLGNSKGNTFSTVTFTIDEEPKVTTQLRSHRQQHLRAHDSGLRMQPEVLF